MSRNKFFAALAATCLFLAGKLRATAVSITGQTRVNPPPTGPALMYSDITGQLQSVLVGTGFQFSGSIGTPTFTINSGVGVNFSESEIPAGTVDGINLIFTLAHAPVAGSLKLYRNGLRQKIGADFTLTGATVTFAGGSQPQVADALIADYRF